MCHSCQQLKGLTEMNIVKPFSIKHYSEVQGCTGMGFHTANPG